MNEGNQSLLCALAFTKNKYKEISMGTIKLILLELAILGCIRLLAAFISGKAPNSVTWYACLTCVGLGVLAGIFLPY